jgi:hypothetical protein
MATRKASKRPAQTAATKAAEARKIRTCSDGCIAAYQRCLRTATTPAARFRCIKSLTNCLENCVE